LFQAGGRTDRHDESNSRFSQFSESAKQMWVELEWTRLIWLRIGSNGRLLLNTAVRLRVP
jgi:hypothetical protein